MGFYIHSKARAGRGGGLAFIFKPCLQLVRNNVYLQYNSFEVMEATIKNQHKCLKICLIYRPGSGSRNRKQRWSRGHKARGQGQGQGHKKNPRPRPRTAFPRTDTLEAKDRNARGQGPRTQAQVLSKKKKKRSSQKFFKRSPLKNVFQKIFQALHKILTFQKTVLSSSRGQANFRGLEASRPRPRTWPSRPRPRTSKWVLEAKDVLEDSTSDRKDNKSSKLSCFFEEFESYLDDVSSRDGKLIFCGDFNFHLEDSLNKDTIRFCSLLESRGYSITSNWQEPSSNTLQWRLAWCIYSPK